MADASCVMHRLYVPLPQPALDRLTELAHREMRRNAQEQAAWLIVRGLREAGLDPESRPGDTPSPLTREVER